MIHYFLKGIFNILIRLSSLVKLNRKAHLTAMDNERTLIHFNTKDNYPPLIHYTDKGYLVSIDPLFLSG